MKEEAQRLRTTIIYRLSYLQFYLKKKYAVYNSHAWYSTQRKKSEFPVVSQNAYIKGQEANTKKKKNKKPTKKKLVHKYQITCDLHKGKKINITLYFQQNKSIFILKAPSKNKFN